MKKIILASNNKHKIEEIQAILTDLDFEVKSLKDEGINIEVEGKILEKLSGKEGFGYDPLFFYEPLNKTFGELSSEEKNRVSHRSNALGILKQRIGEML